MAASKKSRPRVRRTAQGRGVPPLVQQALIDAIGNSIESAGNLLKQVFTTRKTELTLTYADSTVNITVDRRL